MTVNDLDIIAQLIFIDLILLDEVITQNAQTD